MGSLLRNKKIIIIAAAVLLATAAAVLIVILTNGKKGYRNISVTEVAGTVTVGKDGKEYSAYENMHLADGNSLTTLIESFIRFSLDDEKYVKLDEESRAVFTEIGSSGKKTAIELEYGTLVTELTKPLTTDESFVVNTPNSVLAVRGTFFRIYTSVGEDGIVYTDIYTYGGSVAVQRVLPDGTVAREQVTVGVGYKTRIKMDAAETVYVTEVIDGNSENVYPIDPSEIPDDDIVAMYDASGNGHALFMSTGELWQEIENRNIDINEYKSVYDGKKIPPYDGAAENSPESSEESTPEQPEESTPEQPEESTPEQPEESTPEQPEEPTPEQPEEPTPEQPEEPTPEQPEEPIPEQPEEPIPEQPAEHIHNPVTNVTGATCTGNGRVTTVCLDCGEVISDNESPAFGHDWQEFAAQPATCTEAGHTAYSKCAGCGETSGYETIPAAGHEWQSISAQPATCTEAGHTAYSKCAGCGETSGYETIPAAGHEWQSISAQPATCTEAGHTAYSKCANCGETSGYETIAAAGHEWQSISAQPATCTEAGHTAYSKCAGCGETSGYEKIAAAGHEWQSISAQPATCTEAGQTAYSKCANCGETSGYETIAATGHDWQEFAAQPATCTEAGHTAYSKCANCGETKDYEVVEATGHNWENTGDGVVPTCADEGYELYRCSHCGDEKTVTLPVDHDAHLPQRPEYPYEITNDLYIYGIYCDRCGAFLGEVRLPEGTPLPDDYISLISSID